MAKGTSKRKAGRTTEKESAKERVDQRSPNDQSTGGYDPEAYHADGPVPVGHAAIRPIMPAAEGISAGITATRGMATNPGDVPNTGGTAADELWAPMAADKSAMSNEGHNKSLEGVMHHNEQMRECIQNCQECHAICTETAQHCLQMGGKHAEAAHIRLMLDCAQICQTSADFMLRGSSHHPSTCGTCAELCTACAEECERIGQDDAMMKKCAEVCRRCAESCRHMAHAKMAA